MKQILTILFAMFFALTTWAQKTITINAATAEEEFKKLPAGEYNIVVKGDMSKYSGYEKDVWFVDKNIVSINVLDLSKTTGLDSITCIIGYKQDPFHVETLQGKDTIVFINQPAPAKIILSDDTKFVSLGNWTDDVVISATPKNRFYVEKNGFLLTKNGKELVKNNNKGGYFKIPDGVETITSYCFKEEDTVFISQSVKHIEKAYDKHYPHLVISPDNPYFSVQDGFLYNKDKTVLFDATTAKGVVRIPNGVTVIGVRAFYRAGYIDSVILPNTVVTIDTAAFLCASINRIIIPNSVKRIENQAFYNSEPNEIIMSNSIEYIGSETGIIDNGGTVNGTVTCPKSLKKIGYNAGDIELENPTGWYMTMNEQDWKNRKNGISLDKIIYNGFEYDHFLWKDGDTLKPHPLKELTNIIMKEGLDLYLIENYEDILRQMDLFSNNEEYELFAVIDKKVKELREKAEHKIEVLEAEREEIYKIKANLSKILNQRVALVDKRYIIDKGDDEIESYEYYSLSIHPYFYKLD